MAEEKPDEAKGQALVPLSALASAKDQNRVRTDRFKSIYANNAAISFSTYDSSIIFGEIIGEQDDQAVIEEVLKVTMSREMTKLLAVLLGTHLRAWEAQFGEIKIPDLASANAQPTSGGDENFALTQQSEAGQPGEAAGGSVIDATEKPLAG